RDAAGVDHHRRVGATRRRLYVRHVAEHALASAAGHGDERMPRRFGRRAAERTGVTSAIVRQPHAERPPISRHPFVEKGLNFSAHKLRKSLQAGRIVALARISQVDGRVAPVMYGIGAAALDNRPIALAHHGAYAAPDNRGPNRRRRCPFLLRRQRRRPPQYQQVERPLRRARAWPSPSRQPRLCCRMSHARTRWAYCARCAWSPTRAPCDRGWAPRAGAFQPRGGYGGYRGRGLRRWWRATDRRRTNRWACLRAPCPAGRG